MTIARRIAALAAGTAFLAGCGGGGSAPATPAAVTTATVAPTAAPNATATGAPIATAQLTIKYPANFHVARKGASTTRTPAYVNPLNNNKLDIFIDGVDVLPNYTVTNTGDGTQTITGIPIYSTLAHQIVVVEGGSSGYATGPILALGETDLATGSFTPGDVVTLGLTMAMNVSNIGITSDPSNGSDALITSSGTQYSDNVGCSSSSSYPLYLFAADDEQGFVSGAGLGVAIPSITSVTQIGASPPSYVSATTTGLGSGYTIHYPGFNGGILLNAAVINPAWPYANDAINNGGSQYPGLYALFRTPTGSAGPLYYPLYSFVYNKGRTITAQVYTQPQGGC